MTILDLIAQKRIFLPSTAEEFIALQIARKLRDLDNADWYRHIASRHGIPSVLRAYRQAIRVQPDERTLRFRACLKN